ncbi:PREDICTED: target of rapamycin complex subunit lst8-like isoform X2 [Amphimedon queenslandica]|uniref:Target of rapamycin complex subunit lst8 n=1 Tax=Amphimedon queenslandica TaxID=400682 RepID=A0A1X7VV66_AMPQE|nr:PREDICTED: target of rapamycin complex subunit lst8-like isoform X2 [Amphimedon queenslandica]|eukprot:XP_019852280.1 PREDICTED: target of rapamycin complex subunit lst8-like isoform X2 [Amphimedon queenslandica]
MDQGIVLVTGGYDHSLKFWYPHDGVCYRTIPHPDSQVNQLAITPDKRCLVSAAYQQIRMYDIKSSDQTPVYVFEGMTKNVTSVGFYDNGQFMYSGGEDCMARIWDLRGSNQQCQRLFQVSSPVNCMCLHPNQATLIVGDQSGTVHVWDLTTDYNEQLIPEPEVSIHSVHIDPDGAYLAAVNSKGICYVWSLTSSGSTQPITLTPRTKTASHKKYALKCVFSPDSSLLATTSADGTCKVWSTADFSLRNTLKREADKWVWDCAFSCDSQYIFTASDHVARLWHVEQSSPIREYQGHSKAITSIAYSDRQ